MRPGREAISELGVQRDKGAGGMRRRVREFDWAATPLGPSGRWPSSLAFTVDLVLASGFPMAVRWGPRLINIYNDAYAELLGDRHPAALGQPLDAMWPEIKGELVPLHLAILNGERDGFFENDHPWV